MKELELEALVKGDKNALANREGLKPLFSLAETIKRGFSEYSEVDIEKAITGIDVFSLTAEEVQTFLSFIYYSHLDNGRVLNYLYSNIENRNTGHVELVLICGLLIRFVIERDQTFFSLKQLKDEKEIREKHPWLWVDSMSYLNWSFCVDEIGKLLHKEENGFKNLILRIPAFQKRFGKEKLIEAFKKWHPNMNASDRVKLNKWAKEFNIKFGMSISAERLIEGAAFLQNQIMYNESTI